MRHCEATASLSAISDANLYCCAVVIRGANSEYNGVVAEISDDGFYLAAGADRNRFVACRADLNRANGWHLGSGASRNQFIGCLSLSNGQETANTYQGYWVDGTLCAGNIFVGCIADSISSSHQYGFYEGGYIGDAIASKSQYIGCTSSGHGTGWFAFVTDSKPGAPQIGQNGWVDLTAASATPSVEQVEFARINNAAPQAITNFTNGVTGQQLWIVPITANTTLKYGTNIKTNTGADKTLAASALYVLRNLGGVWYEVA
jgi:hypothetical protein